MTHAASIRRPQGGEGTSTIDRLYLHNPTPEYSQAISLATTGLSVIEGDKLAVVSSAFYATELLKRCPVAFDLAGTGSFDPAGFEVSAAGWKWGPVRAVRLDQAAGLYGALVWAEPETPSGPDIAILLRQRAMPDAILNVIVSGPFHRFLPAWRAGLQPAKRPISPRAVQSLLRNAGWMVEQMIAFHGPQAVIWSWLARGARMLGRWEWEDCCTQTMWARYREAGWLWPLAPLGLIRARAI